MAGYAFQKSRESSAKPRKKTASKKSHKPVAKKPPALRQPECIQGYGVVGGFLKKPQFIEVDYVQQEPFVKLAHSEGWLCSAAAAKGRGHRPLARTTLLQDLIQLRDELLDDKPLRASEVKPIFDPMADLGLDDDDPMELPPLRTKGKKNQGKTPARVICFLDIPLPERLQTGGIVEVRVLTHPPRKGSRTKGVVHIHVKDVPWAIQAMAEQVRNGGVEYTPPESTLRRPFYHHRDHAWVCRARTPGGTVKRRSMTVPLFEESPEKMRRPLRSGEFKMAREAALREIEYWRECVELGTEA